MSSQYPAVPAFVLDLEAAQQEGGDAQVLLGELNVSSLPTFVGFVDGKEIGRVERVALEEVEQLYLALAAAAVPREKEADKKATGDHARQPVT